MLRAAETVYSLNIILPEVTTMSVPMSHAIQQFWDAFKATRTDDVDARFFEVCVFDDNEPSANHLADLVVRGIKRATAGLVWSF